MIRASSLTPKNDPEQFDNQAIIAYNPTTKKFEALSKNAITAPPKWKKITAFQNGWVNQDIASFGELAYCKDSQNIVRIEGVVKSGTANSVVFNIDDATCRPKKAISRATHGANGGGYGILVATDGNVTIFTAPGYTPPDTWVVLSCTFPSDQVFF